MKSFKFITISLTRKNLIKIIFCLIILVLLVAVGFFNNLYDMIFFSSSQLYNQLQEKTIGLDPGHGGYDPGFYTGDVKESEIVLEISLKLRRMLEEAGVQVIMTREEDKDLCDTPEGDGKSDKIRDLDNRLKIIEDNNVDIFFSIHANSIPSSVWHGAQTFYQGGDEKSEELAYEIQDNFIEILKNTDRTPLEGDYYMLRESCCTGVVVEVGFLSNPTERELLSNEIYQERVAWALYLGLLNYIS